MPYAPAESLGGVDRDGPSMQVFIQLFLYLDFESEMWLGSSSLRSLYFSVIYSPGICLVIAAKEGCGNRDQGHKRSSVDL